MPVLAHLAGDGRRLAADQTRDPPERVAAVQARLDLLPFLQRQLAVMFVHGSFRSVMDGKVWRLSTIAGKGLLVYGGKRSGQRALVFAGGLRPAPHAN